MQTMQSAGGRASDAKRGKTCKRWTGAGKIQQFPSTGKHANSERVKTRMIHFLLTTKQKTVHFEW